MSIYTDLLEAVSNGKKFKVDLINKSLWIDRKEIIREGVRTDENKEFIEKWDLALDYGNKPTDENPWEMVEFLYKEYKYSVPGKSPVKSYFKANSVDELTDSDLAYNISRDYAQAQIEGYILLASLAGILTWEFGDHWFWQGNDKDLVILKNFVE